MPVYERTFEDVNRYNIKRKRLVNVLTGAKNARLLNLQNSNTVDIFWDLNDKAIRHQVFKIRISGKVDGKKVSLEAVIPFEQFYSYARDF